MTKQEWLDSALWDFAHALSLELGFENTAQGRKADEAIHRDMRMVIEIYSRIEGG